MTAKIIDGKQIAANFREELAEQAAGLRSRGIEPGLAVILVGDDAASHVYVKNKIRACENTGIKSIEHRLNAAVSADEIAALIDKLNADPDVHGILLQLPLPHGLQGHQEELVQRIASEKDVDGLTAANAGRMFLGLEDAHVPCTPQGSMHLIREVREDLKGLHAVVVGRSNLFGKPMAQLLLHANCTVTIAHRFTTNLSEICQTADILVVAVGKPMLIEGEWIKEDATVIDVGINRMENGKLCGDVDYEGALTRASAITPVPGGVGPMTIAYLLANTLRAAAKTA